MPHTSPTSALDDTAQSSEQEAAYEQPDIDDDILSILTNKQFLGQAPANDNGQLLLKTPQRSTVQMCPGSMSWPNKMELLKDILEFMERPESGEPHKHPSNWKAFHLNAFYGLLDPTTGSRDGRGPCARLKDYAMGNPDRRYEPFRKSLRSGVEYMAIQYDSLMNQGKESQPWHGDPDEEEVAEALYDPRDGTESVYAIAKRIWNIWGPIEEEKRKARTDRELVINAFQSRKIEAEKVLGILSSDDDTKGTTETNGKDSLPPGIAFPLKENHLMAVKVLTGNPTSKEVGKSVKGRTVKNSQSKKKRAPAAGKRAAAKKKKLRPSSIAFQDEETSVLKLSSDSDDSLDDEAGAAKKSEKQRLFEKDVKIATRCCNGPPTELEDEHIDARHNDAFENSERLLEDITNERASHGNDIDIEKITKTIQESPKTKILKKQGIVTKNINRLLKQKKLMQDMGASDEQLADVQNHIDILMGVSKDLSSEFIKEVI